MTKISFKTLRAASLRVGDIVPAPTAWGGWDKHNVRRIIKIERDSQTGMIVFNLNCGGMFRSFPENKTPVDI
jgi:hypothetical protein